MDFKLNKAWNLTIRFSCTLSQIKEHGGGRRGTIIITTTTTTIIIIIIIINIA
jgi:hypothetical protein